ncbi:MAG: adenine deaminase [Burkholderiaceae bacterium]
MSVLPSSRGATAARIGRRIDQAMGREPADLVVKNVRWLNLVTGELVDGDIAIGGDRIIGTYEPYDGRIEIDGRGLTAVPGFIDAHVHVESSLVMPDEFDRCMLPRGTTTAICDPHEIANVLGLDGLRYFLACAETMAMDLRVQLSSCVPATPMETAGARLLADDLLSLRAHPKVIGLAEFMNFPGVLGKDPEVLDKLAAFDGQHIDGHAPLLAGKPLNAYLSAGICNCHETTNIDEGREKLRKGMQLLIREGTVCKDVDALAPLLTETTSGSCGFCTDDRNPLDTIEQGHLDHLIRKAIRLGAPLLHVYRAASWSTARSFGLRDRGLIAPGKRADIVLLSDLEECRVERVIAGGRVVDDLLFASRPKVPAVGLGSVRRPHVTAADFVVPSASATGPVIGLVPGGILTDHLTMTLPWADGVKSADPARDVLKIAVLERHGQGGGIGRGFVQGFRITRGAIASSVGHDSHNLCVIGDGDEDMAAAVNRLIDIGGGFVAMRDGQVIAELPLPIAGLMSDQPYEVVRDRLLALRAAVRQLGCPLDEPFLQMAFLPLAVIPSLKITDQGLVDVDRFMRIAV